MSSQSNLYKAPRTNDIEVNNEITIAHSKLGIASFFISVISGILMLGLFGYAGVLENSTPGGIDEGSTETILLGLALIGTFGIVMVSFILGILGLFKKNCQKIYSILGATFSALIIICTIGLMIIGTMMEA